MGAPVGLLTCIFLLELLFLPLVPIEESQASPPKTAQVHPGPYAIRNLHSQESQGSAPGNRLPFSDPISKAPSQETSDEENPHHPCLLLGHFCKWHCRDRKFQTDAPRPSVPPRWLIIRSARGLLIWAEPEPKLFNWECHLLQLQTIRDKFFFSQILFKESFSFTVAVVDLLMPGDMQGVNANLLKMSGKQTKYVFRLNDNRRLHLYLRRERHQGTSRRKLR